MVELPIRPAIFRRILPVTPLGMSVTELMVSLTIILVLASVAIPSYLTYSQQRIVISLVLPPLRMIETDISIHYNAHQNMPDEKEFTEIMKNHATEFIELSLNGNSLQITLNAPADKKGLASLNGMTLNAYPAFSDRRITGWTLKGILAERLGINN